jgi:hypothetical protein
VSDLADGIVYQSPSEPEIVGKEAVRKWVDALGSSSSLPNSQ